MIVINSSIKFNWCQHGMCFCVGWAWKGENCTFVLKGTNYIGCNESVIYPAEGHVLVWNSSW